MVACYECEGCGLRSVRFPRFCCRCGSRRFAESPAAFYGARADDDDGGPASAAAGVLVGCGLGALLWALILWALFGV